MSVLRVILFAKASNYIFRAQYKTSGNLLVDHLLKL